MPDVNISFRCYTACLDFRCELVLTQKIQYACRGIDSLFSRLVNSVSRDCCPLARDLDGVILVIVVVEKAIVVAKAGIILDGEIQVVL